MEKLGTLAMIREYSILKFLYEHQEWRHIDQGNLEAAIEEVDDSDSSSPFFSAIEDLMAYGYIAVDEDLECFYHITDNGIEYYERHKKELDTVSLL